MDFSSKDVVQNVHDIRRETMTIMREELNFALKGAALELQVHDDSLLEPLNRKKTEAGHRSLKYLRLAHFTTKPRGRGGGYTGKHHPTLQYLHLGAGSWQH